MFYGSAANHHVSKVKRNVIDLKGDIGRILPVQSWGDIHIDVFIAGLAGASCNTDITEVCGMPKAIDP